jgi:hypothetical protein
LIAAFINRFMSRELVKATDVLSFDAINSVELLAAAGLCSAQLL